MRKRKKSLAARKLKQVAKTTVGGVFGTVLGAALLPVEFISRADGTVHDEPYLVEEGLGNLFGGLIELAYDWDDE